MEKKTFVVYDNIKVFILKPFNLLRTLYTQLSNKHKIRTTTKKKRIKLNFVNCSKKTHKFSIFGVKIL